MDPISRSFWHTVHSSRRTQECTGCHVDLTELARSIRLAPALHTRYLGYACETRHSNTTKYHIEEDLRYVHRSAGVEQPSDKRMVVKLSTIRRKLA